MCLCVLSFVKSNVRETTTWSVSSPSPVALSFHIRSSGQRVAHRDLTQACVWQEGGPVLIVPLPYKQVPVHTHSQTCVLGPLSLKFSLVNVHCAPTVSKTPLGTPEGENGSRLPVSSSQRARDCPLRKAAEGTQQSSRGPEADMTFSLVKQGHFLELVACQPDHE